MVINANKVGLVLGGIAGGIHLLWSLCVLFNVAQSMIDFILWMHMIYSPITVADFSLQSMIILVLFTTAWGYAVGYALAKLWNYLHR